MRDSRGERAEGRGRTDTAPLHRPRRQTEMEKWLAQVDGPQQESYQREVMKPFETALAELQKSYVTALESRIAAASTAGQLDVALGWRNELQRFREGGQAVPADDADLATVAAPLVAKALPPLRTQFRTHQAKLEADRLARAKAAFAKYDAVLSPAITQLTQRQRLDDALLLKTKRDEVQNAWLPAPRSQRADSSGDAIAFRETARRCRSQRSSRCDTRRRDQRQFLARRGDLVPGVEGRLPPHHARRQG